ncbi:hypothetical protein RFM98_22810 [Mesorhizobium sp. VK9D]|uniref:hypothetical protein n=1 Tax=Mesorhizobium australafricanum TaxID=3072311 RepID=UPI002A24F16B|nr:hypothetical protein [Mesorhizobium sp. VK9D]MDX8455568.1 hypothetical protein [Mesorhizobium sp. VK9D]
MDRRSFMGLAGLYTALALLPGPSKAQGGQAPAQPDSGSGTRIVLSGDYGYEKKSIRDLDIGATIDARMASFTVANSRNSNPDATTGCDEGELAINRYPVVVENCPGVRFVGGRFDGKVPLTSDWQDTYCNSAALLVRNGTTGATIESVRVRRCWDAIRIGEGAGGFRLKGCWLSETRDDAMENDYLLGGIVEDCLFDECFSGISVDPAKNARDGTGQVVRIDGSLIHMHGYPAKGEVTHEAPIKATEKSPMLRITGSVFALATANMRGFRRLGRTWHKMIESRDNVLLWLPGESIPFDLPPPPSGFRVLTGASAREYWDKARLKWIAAHRDVARFSDEAM